MRKLIIVSLLVVPAAAAHAGGYIIPQENARSLALSSADVAAQNGAEALFNNTSALAGLEGLNLALSDELLVNRTTWFDPDSPASSSLIPQYNTPPSGAIAFGKHFAHDTAVGIGVGVDVPAGGAIVWPNGWKGQETIQSVKQQVFRIAAGIGVQPIKYLKLGFSYDRLQGTEELHQSLNFLDHYGDGGLGMSGGGNTYGFSATVTVPKIPLSLGVMYTTVSHLNLSGNAHFTNVPPAFTTLIHDQAVTAKQAVPGVLQLGASYAVQPNITVMAAYSWEKWSGYKEDRFVGADGFQVAVDREYENAHVWRGGAEWNVGGERRLTLRAGALRSISEQPTFTVSPSLTDGNSTGASLGAGFQVVPSLRVDFGYQHVWFDTVAATGTEAFPGSYKTHVDLMSLGLSWRPL